MVAQSPITHRLRAAGATEADLEVIQFSKFKPDLPFSMWSVWAPGQPEQEARLDKLLLEHSGLCKAYCTYRWLILDDPPSSPNKEAGWNYLAHILALPIYELGIKTIENQQKRAKKPRSAVGDDGETIHQIIATLISKPENRDLRAKELWPHLRAALGWHGFDPRDEHVTGDARDAYSYVFRDGRRRISYGSFANIVSRLRKKSS